MNWKKFSVYGILLFMMVPLIANFVIAAETSVLPGAPDWVDAFYEKTAPYLIPTGIEKYLQNALTAWIISIIAMIILFVVFLDASMIVSPFSNWVNWVIAVGLGIVAILLGLVRSITFFIVAASAGIFGVAGSLAVLGSVIISVAILIFFFFGGNWLIQYLKGVKERSKALEGELKGVTGGIRIRGLRKMAEEAER